MKKIITTIVCALILNFGNAQKVTFQSILADILNIAVQVHDDQVMTPQNIYNQTIIVNSVSNANFSGGQCRKAIKFSIPQNTERWYYRITVLDKTQDFQYLPNESLYYNLINKRNLQGFVTNDISMNFYVMTTSGDADNFLRSRAHSYIPTSSKLHSNSCYGISNLKSDNIWLGLENLSYMDGARVIIEIVAYTRVPKIKPYVTIQSKKQISEAKELYDLGVLTKKSYDSIVQLYSPRITRQEALEKLREAKKQLDLGEISQLEYNNLLEIYKPIIENKEN